MFTTNQTVFTNESWYSFRVIIVGWALWPSNVKYMGVKEETEDINNNYNLFIRLMTSEE